MFNFDGKKIPQVTLNRDLIKQLKRGHQWLFADCFNNSHTPDGLVVLRSKKDEVLGLGLWQSDVQLRFRLLCSVDEDYFNIKKIGQTLQVWFERQWTKALDVRKSFPSSETNSFRLINGEGDGLPGLIIDIYDSIAVIKHDHPATIAFWEKTFLSDVLLKSFPYLTSIYHKKRRDQDNLNTGETVFGTLPHEVVFRENGRSFCSNIAEAAKTGFFLDQRDNRLLLSRFSKDKNMLNLFSYTGGFSVFAASGGAKSVTSVDIAEKAIQAAKRNFEINELKTPHQAIAMDAFEFIANARKENKKWDLIVADPPSFAPNQKSVPRAIESYKKLFSECLKLSTSQGVFAASSCSAHITHEMFKTILSESLSMAKRKATILYWGGQPFDHPYPIAMEELRYLKFFLLRLD